MSDTTCQCGKPTGSTATLCMDCRRTLEFAIVNVAAYYADLDTLKARLVRFGDRGRSNETPLGMDARFARFKQGSEVEYDARNTVVAWCRYVMEHVSIAAGPTCGPYCLHVSCSQVRKTRPPVDTVRSMSNYLLRWSDWLRTCPLGAQVLDEFCDLEGRLRRLIDRPADRWYAGPCNALVMRAEEIVECGEPLYALSDFGDVTCRECEATYDVKQRREWLLAAAEDHEATATVIARAIVALGEDQRDEGRLAGRIRKWAGRNQIFAMRHDYVSGVLRPLYRIGDVLDLLADDMRAEEERRRRAEEQRARKAARRTAS